MPLSVKESIEKFRDRKNHSPLKVNTRDHERQYMKKVLETIVVRGGAELNAMTVGDEIETEDCRIDLNFYILACY